MEHRISVLFYARKSKKTSKGLAPIYIRITVNSQRLEHSIQRYVDVGQWSARSGRVKGSNDQARQINLYLDSLNGKVQKLEREMTLDGIPVGFSSFREKWLGLTEV
ncbi:MAG TPA: Arm DNA-binding domain-containing protein, partial [Puia sp.]|nr:Arm DNA-binding domain-containing protein [Puia sp.]